jgi:hypothetical protein
MEPYFASGMAGGKSLFTAVNGGSPTYIKTAAGILHKVRLFNPNSVQAWLVLWDSNSGVVVGTTPPKDGVPVPAGGYWDDMLPYGGWVFANGLAVAAVINPTTGTPTASGVFGTLFFT